MEENKNQYMEVAYKLYVDGDKGLELTEEAPAQRPFQFITGFGVALEAFEAQLSVLEKGAAFDITIPKEQAYGDYHDDYVLDLSRELFMVDGKYDGEHVYPGAIVPLQNEEGTRFLGRVVEVGPKQVKIDLNHPLAGETLHFKGTIVENRPATEEEVRRLMVQLTGGCSGDCNGGCGSEGCGGGCNGGCGGGCNGGCQ